MRSILILIGAAMAFATVKTLIHFAREPADVSDEVRYSVWADRKQKMENLEQLFAASGAQVKVLSFTDQVSGHSLDGPWTSQYEAELEFLNDCQLQESPAAYWSPDPRSRNITHFRQGERRLINGRLAVDGFDGSMSVGLDGRHRYTRRIMMENGKTVGDRTWWLEQNRIPTGRGSDVAKPPGMRPGESIPVATNLIPCSKGETVNWRKAGCQQS